LPRGKQITNKMVFPETSILEATSNQNSGSSSLY
jgi:hypothetical protein